MSEALRNETWDIIIADHTLPGFSGLQALHILHDSGLDIPLIFVSGATDELAKVDMMLAGASGFIAKHSLSRLVQAVARELREAGSRRGFAATLLVDASRGVNLQPDDSDRAIEAMKQTGADVKSLTQVESELVS